MNGSSGIFAGLRRRRWALGLAFGYALLLNALLGTSVDAAMAAAGRDPLAATPLCSPAGPAPAERHNAPAGDHHHQTCPLCGPACPMGGCTPLQSGPPLALATPGELFPAPAGRPDLGVAPGRSLYASDTDSQGPPAA
ncbi:MAG TPA: DUF2946 family protein [Dongiaceae bacterium]|jgi:hypothetical protein|nr:DUF2946 family protein [Dongiaceae bacterium]